MHRKHHTLISIQVRAKPSRSQSTNLEATRPCCRRGSVFNVHPDLQLAELVTVLLWAGQKVRGKPLQACVTEGGEAEEGGEAQGTDEMVTHQLDLGISLPVGRTVIISQHDKPSRDCSSGNILFNPVWSQTHHLADLELLLSTTAMWFMLRWGLNQGFCARCTSSLTLCYISSPQTTLSS